MIIADTSAILATIDPDAAEHAACVKILGHLRRPMFVSHMVVAETDYLLTTRFGVPTANRFLADVARGAWELAATDAEDINDVVTVNTRYQELRLGATDCLNVVLAARYGTAVLFTLDHRHYRAVAPLAGPEAFILLPSDHDQWSMTVGRR
ncbi:MAG TPA: PIN domain-containing protein [Micromonosporaceae bacterium]|nr:PIN domain-containing protein [Micromonosporaceae bacterium]